MATHTCAATLQQSKQVIELLADGCLSDEHLKTIAKHPQQTYTLMYDGTGVEFCYQAHVIVENKPVVLFHKKQQEIAMTDFSPRSKLMTGSQEEEQAAVRQKVIDQYRQVHDRLIQAVQENDITTVESLIHLGLNVFATDIKGHCALYYACQPSCDGEILVVLISQQTNLASLLSKHDYLKKAIAQEKVLLALVEAKKSGLLKQLLHYDAKFFEGRWFRSNPIPKATFAAVMLDDVAMVEVLTRGRRWMAYRDLQDRNPLSVAMHFKQQKVAVFLLQTYIKEASDETEKFGTSDKDVRCWAHHLFAEDSKKLTTEFIQALFPAIQPYLEHRAYWLKENVGEIGLLDIYKKDCPPLDELLKVGDIQIIIEWLKRSGWSDSGSKMKEIFRCALDRERCELLPELIKIQPKLLGAHDKKHMNTIAHDFCYSGAKDKIVLLIEATNVSKPLQLLLFFGTTNKKGLTVEGVAIKQKKQDIVELIQNIKKVSVKQVEDDWLVINAPKLVLPTPEKKSQ
ncbi:MAG: hypothetical protein ACPGUD_07100 [Parashewanella sp.]